LIKAVKIAVLRRNKLHMKLSWHSKQCNKVHLCKKDKTKLRLGQETYSKSFRTTSITVKIEDFWFGFLTGLLLNLQLIQSEKEGIWFIYS